MKIWVDGDACPKGVKEILFRAADRKKIMITFVANQFLRLPQSAYLDMIQVPDGADVADDRIVELCGEGDLIITADIPLAARVVKKGATALDPRGRIYNSNNVGQLLDMRNFMDELRGAGVETGGPKGFNARDNQEFSNKLDRMLTQL
jgi:uncharacterized protein YaiI (UPF0178 family)